MNDDEVNCEENNDDEVKGQRRGRRVVSKACRALDETARRAEELSFVYADEEKAA